jgi:NADH-quinone oxidoreductase subunit C
MTHNEILGGVDARFHSSILSTYEFRGELTLVIRKNDIVEVCNFLKHDYSFDALRDLCGLDMNTPVDRFFVVYTLYSLSARCRIRLKVQVDEKDLNVPTVTGVWSTANFHEREAYDMFGIIFTGHPDLRRIYMPEEFEYFPLRKDFPLMGIPDSIPLPKK